uniref:NR LBD domain-containing protein n=2 Tax=Caenorhabditis japonica TaxID=281687 RepID=A0A8R1HV14_CAEJA
MESLIKSFLVYVRPILEYGSVIFSPIGTVLIRRIESVQKSFVYRCCTKFGVHYASYFSTLETLVLESLEYRRLITDMMFLYKCIVAKDIACPRDIPTIYDQIFLISPNIVLNFYGRPSSCNLNERSLKHVPFTEPRLVATQIPASNSSLSGITPVLTMMIDLVMKPFRQLNFSTTEFALLQAIMFFDPDTDGLDSASQRNVIAEQKKLLAVLFRHLQKAYNFQMANDRYASMILRIPSIRRAAAKKNESLQVLDMLQMHEMNSLVKETSLGPRPSTVQQRMGMGAGVGCLNFSNETSEDVLQ